VATRAEDKRGRGGPKEKRRRKKQAKGRITGILEMSPGETVSGVTLTEKAKTIKEEILILSQLEF